LLQEQIAQYRSLASKPFLTRKEVALYISVSERSISEWAARPDAKNQFLESNAGGEPRYRRDWNDE